MDVVVVNKVFAEDDKELVMDMVKVEDVYSTAAGATKATHYNRPTRFLITILQIIFC